MPARVYVVTREGVVGPVCHDHADCMTARKKDKVTVPLWRFDPTQDTAQSDVVEALLAAFAAKQGEILLSHAAVTQTMTSDGDVTYRLYWSAGGYDSAHRLIGEVADRHRGRCGGDDDD